MLLAASASSRKLKSRITPFQLQRKRDQKCMLLNKYGSVVCSISVAWHCSTYKMRIFSYIARVSVALYSTCTHQTGLPSIFTTFCGLFGLKKGTHTTYYTKGRPPVCKHKHYIAQMEESLCYYYNTCGQNNGSINKRHIKSTSISANVATTNICPCLHSATFFKINFGLC